MVASTSGLSHRPLSGLVINMSAILIPGGHRLRLENERYGDEPYGDRHLSPSPIFNKRKGVYKMPLI